jgi:hypothetical protein
MRIVLAVVARVGMSGLLRRPEQLARLGLGIIRVVVCGRVTS